MAIPVLSVAAKAVQRAGGAGEWTFPWVALALFLLAHHGQAGTHRRQEWRGGINMGWLSATVVGPRSLLGFLSASNQYNLEG